MGTPADAYVIEIHLSTDQPMAYLTTATELWLLLLNGLTILAFSPCVVVGNTTAQQVLPYRICTHFH
jgi:hypothetical protein